MLLEGRTCGITVLFTLHTLFEAPQKEVALLVQWYVEFHTNCRFGSSRRLAREIGLPASSDASASNPLGIISFLVASVAGVSSHCPAWI